MFGLSLWSHPWTDPKSEVTHCVTSVGESIKTVMLKKTVDEANVIILLDLMLLQ